MRIGMRMAALLVFGVAACDDTLTLAPSSEVPEATAISDAASARAALAGAYDALQDGSYYGGDFLLYSDLLSEDVQHSGTFSDFAATDANRVLPDNETLLVIWEAIYQSLGVSNQLIARVPLVPTIDAADRDDIVGQAHFLRALALHDLVKLWGPIPMPLAPAASIAEASQIARSSVADVYTQILADLTAAEQTIGNTGDTRKATLGAVLALRSRVLLYQGSDWQGVVDAANAIEPDYSLASSYDALFSEEGQDTPEDIFRVSFTAVEFNNVGFYYFSRSFGGRWEVAPTFDLIDAYGVSSDPAFDPDTVQTTDDDGNLLFTPADPRAAWSITFDARDRIFGAKYPTPVGAEDVHVIRFAEVILNKAEALAHLPGQLTAAIAEVNRVRSRVGAPQLDATGLNQQQVLDLVWRERRLELAFEGFRWPDLVRTGQAQAVMGASVAPYEVLLPIPQAELDVSPNVSQTVGY